MASPAAPVDTIDAALRALRRPGALVLVVDDFDRENEGDLIGAAGDATRDAIAFVVRRSTGIVCVSVDAARAGALDLRAMVPENADPFGTAFTVSVDARAGTTTGVSAADRAATIRALAGAAGAGAGAAFSRPGHVFPLVARAGGVLARDGHTEASLDLVRLARRGDAAFLAEVVSEAPGGDMAALPELRALAAAHELPLVSIADLQRFRARREVLVVPRGGARFDARHARASYVAAVRGAGGAVAALLVLRAADGAAANDARAARAAAAAAAAGGALLVITASADGRALDDNVARRAAEPAAAGEAAGAAAGCARGDAAPPAATAHLYPAPRGARAAGAARFCDRATAEIAQVAAAVLRALGGGGGEPGGAAGGEPGGGAPGGAPGGGGEPPGGAADAGGDGAPRGLLMAPAPALPAAADEDEEEASLVARAAPRWPRVTLLLVARGAAPPAVWEYGVAVGEVAELDEAGATS
jgi:3,4-dihydroxy-2-butanone 4-phosphate synthase